MDINAIQFGILSTEAIRQMSVTTIDTYTKKIGANRGVYDLKLGADLGSKVSCASCGLNLKKCPGHFGHIELSLPVPHPLCLRTILSFLRCTCIHCSELLIPSQITDGLPSKEVAEMCEKVETCPHCGLKNGAIQLLSDTCEFLMYTSRKKTEEAISLSSQNILNIFEGISESTIRQLGFQPEHFHPKDLIMQVLPVLPPCSRPYVIRKDGNICDDDLTCQYIEIIKGNNLLKDCLVEMETITDDDPKHEELSAQALKSYQSVVFRIATLFNNSASKAKHPSNGRAIKGLKERLAGKTGLMRNNLMGKRVEQSGRTVIGADPNLRSCELGVPKEFANTLTVPVIVTESNREELMEMLLDGRAKNIIRKGADNGDQLAAEFVLFTPGTIVFHNDIILRNGKELKAKDLKLQDGDIILREGEMIPVELPKRKPFTLNIGDKVVRKLMDGDVVILNRQPSLHAGSMIAQRVRVLEGKTLRFNLAICKLLNADFDFECRFFTLWSKTGSVKSV